MKMKNLFCKIGLHKKVSIVDWTLSGCCLRCGKVENFVSSEGYQKEMTSWREPLHGEKERVRKLLIKYQHTIRKGGGV
jgi:hypothetical protein